MPACRAFVKPIELVTGKEAYYIGKPNPLMMRTGLRMLHCHSADAVMVGDRHFDRTAARENGVPFVGCLYGLFPAEVTGADAEVKSAGELPEAIERLTAL